jgi:acyl-CoA dehydrogenase
MTTRFLRVVASGDKRVALGVSEPHCGSDAAAIRTTGVPNGNDYIITGLKEYVTGGMAADYLTVAFKEGDQFSLILVDLSLPGISREPLSLQGWWMAGTCRIRIDAVRVPGSFLIGRSGDGFRLLMNNFNHERFLSAVTSNRLARVCLESALSHARERKTFGKRLIDHPVIRHKLSDMAGLVIGQHSLNLAMMRSLSAGDRHTPAVIAVGKVTATRVLEKCAREASQILGATGYRQGHPVERIFRDMRVACIGAGSEDVLVEFSSRSML